MTEVTKLLVLSTGHITKETNSLLTIIDMSEWPCSGGPYGDYGWFLYAHDENCDEGDQKIPDDLWAVMQFARKEGCNYILLDRDGDTTEELPIYDW